jgi:predicted RNase H-like HicB family nuclease
MENKFNVYIWKEGEWFIAQCVDIDVASQGKTITQAISNLKEALELYLEEFNLNFFKSKKNTSKKILKDILVNKKEIKKTEITVSV